MKDADPIIIIFCMALFIAMALHFCQARADVCKPAETKEWPDEMPPPKYQEQLWQAAIEAMKEKHEPLACFQRNDCGGTSVCISEEQWRRMNDLKPND